MLRLIFAIFTFTLLASPAFAAQSGTPAMDAMLERAQKGDADSELALGNLSHSGKDYTEARKWYLKAAKHGSGRAQYYLGKMYKDGEGVSKNYKEAVNWWRKAAGSGDVIAQTDLGNLYATGENVGRDYAEAARWWRMAAQQGDIDAQWALGTLYSLGSQVRGSRVKRDYAEAAKWWRMGAEQGDPYAQFYLGQLYMEGNGVSKDYAEALFWLMLSAKPTNTTVGKRPEHIPLGHGIDELKKKLTPDQVEAIKKRLEDWAPHPTPTEKNE